MKQEIQKVIWDREQIVRIQSGDNGNRRRLNVILKKLLKLKLNRPSSNIRILNIGIGNGLLESLLINSGFLTFSLDPSGNAVEALASKLSIPESHLKVGSCDNIPFEGRLFDFVVMSEVIEHLDDETLNETMHELRRVLKPNGYLIGTCPDNEDVAGKTHACPHCGGNFHRVGHVRSFTNENLRAYLSKHFIVNDCYTFRGMDLNFKGTIMYWYQSLPYRIARIFGSKTTIPQEMGQHLFFCAKNTATNIYG